MDLTIGIEDCIQVSYRKLRLLVMVTVDPDEHVSQIRFGCKSTATTATTASTPKQVPIPNGIILHA